MPFLDDLLGVQDVTANGEGPHISRARLNIISPGATVVDNPADGTIDLTIPGASVDIGDLTAIEAEITGIQAVMLKADGTVALTGNLNAGAHLVSGVANPVSAQDAATKAYVDAVAQGLDIKQSVRLLSTTNVASLTGTPVIDSVTPSNGDRVTLTGQSTGSQNGIYVVGTPWTRATDADTSAKVTAGMFCFVTEGTLYHDTGWVLTTNDAITLGSTSLAFTQFTGAGGAGDFKADGSVAMTANLNANSHKLTNVTDPTSAQDAVTKAYFDAFTAGIGGAVGGRRPLYLPPSTPHAYDHEFDSITAPADMEIYNRDGSAVVTLSGTPDFYDNTLTTGSVARAAFHTNARRSHARIQMPSVNTDNTYAFKATSALPTNCFLWGSAFTPTRWAAGAGGDGNCMLGFFADVSGHADQQNGVFIGYGNVGGNLRQGRYMSTASGSATVLVTSSGDTDTGIGNPWDYFGIQKIGTVFHGWSFRESGEKQYWGSITYGTTVVWMGWYVRCADNAAPGQTVFDLDFFRFLSGIAMPG